MIDRIKLHVRSKRLSVGKKEEGSAVISRFLPLLIVIVVVSMLVVSFSGYIRILDIKDEISLTMRKYIIRMETTGYLTAEDEKALTAELNELGVSNIDYSGTTKSEVEYGDVIYLHIKASLEAEVYTISSALNGTFGTEIFSIDETRSSTSQQ